MEKLMDPSPISNPTSLSSEASDLQIVDHYKLFYPKLKYVYCLSIHGDPINIQFNSNTSSATIRYGYVENNISRQSEYTSGDLILSNTYSKIWIGVEYDNSDEFLNVLKSYNYGGLVTFNLYIFDDIEVLKDIPRITYDYSDKVSIYEICYKGTIRKICSNCFTGEYEEGRRGCNFVFNKGLEEIENNAFGQYAFYSMTFYNDSIILNNNQFNILNEAYVYSPLTMSKFNKLIDSTTRIIKLY